MARVARYQSMALDSRPTNTMITIITPRARPTVSTWLCCVSVRSSGTVSARYTPNTKIPNVVGQRTDLTNRESRSVGVQLVNRTMSGKTNLWKTNATTKAIRTITPAVAGSSQSGSPSPKRANMGFTKMVSMRKSAGESATGE